MNKLALVLLAVSVPLWCAAQDLPSADQVINHFIEATGGRAAWEARHSQVEHGTFEFAKLGVKGTITIYEAAPDKNLAIVELPAIGKLETGSNGAVAWENSAIQGPRVKQGAERADTIREAAFNAPLYWQKLYAKGETTGSEMVEGHDCYKIVLTPKEGNPLTEYYDKKSGLLVKTTSTITSQIGDVNAEVVYDDYRKDGDLLSAHKVLNRAAQQEFVVQIESVEINPEIPKDRFEPPAEIKALLGKETATTTPPSPGQADKSAAKSDAGGKLVVYMQGSPVATEAYTVKKSSSGVDIDGSGSATLGTMKVDIEKFEVVTNAKLEPVQAIAKAKLGTIPMNVNTTFAGGQAKNEIENGQGPQTKSIPVHANAVVVNANLPLYPWTLLAMRASFDTRDPQPFPIYVLGQAEVSGTVVFKGREHVDFAGKSADLNHLTASGATPQGQPISLDFWVDDNRKLIKIAVPSQGVEAYQDGFEPVARAAASQ